MGENGRKNISVMLADDNRRFCETLKEFFDLQDNISVCDVVNNGEQALEHLDSLKPDAIVLDVVMPKVSRYNPLFAYIGH